MIEKTEENNTHTVAMSSHKIPKPVTVGNGKSHSQDVDIENEEDEIIDEELVIREEFAVGPGRTTTKQYKQPTGNTKLKPPSKTQSEKRTASQASLNNQDLKKHKTKHQPTRVDERRNKSDVQSDVIVGDDDDEHHGVVEEEEEREDSVDGVEEEEEEEVEKEMQNGSGAEEEEECDSETKQQNPQQLSVFESTEKKQRAGLPQKTFEIVMFPLCPFTTNDPNDVKPDHIGLKVNLRGNQVIIYLHDRQGKLHKVYRDEFVHLKLYTHIESILERLRGIKDQTHLTDYETRKSDVVKLLEKIQGDVDGSEYAKITPPKVPYKPKGTSGRSTDPVPKTRRGNSTSKKSNKRGSASSSTIINTDTPRGKMKSMISTLWDEIEEYIDKLPATYDLSQVKNKTNAFIKQLI